MPPYTLGLDLGTNSVGWAMIAHDGQIFDSGRRLMFDTRAFSAGLAMETDKVGTPRGQERRRTRSQRRTVRRRRQRVAKLRRILQKAGLLPADPDAFHALMAQNPYLLRARAATPDEKLEPYEIGRALYHLGHRRGFKSNKRVQATKDPDKETDPQAKKKAKEDEKNADAGKELHEQLRAEGITLGQYLARFVPEPGNADPHNDPAGVHPWIRNRKRNEGHNRATLRAMYAEEFEAIWTAQTAHHPNLLTDALKARARDAIFTQGRLWWPMDSVGTCPLTGELRCPKGHWAGQEFRLWQEINNLRLYSPSTRQETPLSDDQRRRLHDALATRKTMKFTAIRKHLGLPKNQSFRGFEQGAQRDALDGNAVHAALTKGPLAPWYKGLPEDVRAEVHDALVELEADPERNRVYGPDEDGLRRKARTWGLSDEQTETLIEVEAGLPDGHYKVSLAAIRRLLPHLARGLRVDEAVPAAGFAPPPRPENLDRLPPVKDVDPYLTNPLVCRALTEARQVVNTLIHEYGKPAEIVVELAREMRQSRSHRREIQNRQKQNEKLNKEAEKEIAAVAQQARLMPPRDAVRRYKLWLELRAESGDPAQCPYCGASIGLAKALSQAVEIDHIIPRSRRPGDNGFMNLVLCCAGCNRAKGNRTPYEWLGPNPDRYQAMLHRVKKLPAPKRDRFALENAEDLEEAIRGLIDAFDPLLKATQHTSRAAVAYLQSLYPPDRQRKAVRCVQGRVTYDLRRMWGLNARDLGLGPADTKNRHDHRHHAIDALVIALTTHKHVHALASAYARMEAGDRRPDMPPPDLWQDRDAFRREVRDESDEIGQGLKRGISYRPTRPATRHNTRGSLHEDMGLGPVWINKDAGDRNPTQYVKRVPINKLTPALLSSDSIRNPEIRDLLRAECIRRGLAEEVPEATKSTWQLDTKSFRLIRRALKYWRPDGPQNGDWQPDTRNYKITAPKRTLQNGLASPLPILPMKASKGGAVPIKRVRVLVASTTARPAHTVDGRPAKFVRPGDTGANHHLEIYEKPDGTWTGRVITRLDVCRRLARGQPAVCRAHEDGYPFVMSLAINDMVWLCGPKTQNVKGLYRIQNTSNGPDVVFRLHTDARTDANEKKVRLSTCSAFQEHHVTKVRVDPIGRVTPYHDQTHR